MDIIIEKKLSAKDRRNMSDVKFGLPSQKKYPLNDKEHVRKAIQFFKFCPQKDRAELANNINKKIKEFNMTVNVSKDNPFYKYANKSVVTESFDSITNTNIKCNHCSSIVTEFIREIKKIIFMDRHVDVVDTIFEIETAANNALCKLDECDCDSRTVAVTCINSIADSHIKSFGKYKDYETNSLNESSYPLDILLAFTDSIVESFNKYEGMSILENLKKDALLESVLSRKYDNPKIDYVMARNISYCNNTLQAYLETANKYKLESFMDYTKQTAKDRIENEIYIIDTHNKTNGGVPVIDLSRLESWINKNNVRFADLNSIDIFKFENINYIDCIREVNDINGQSVCIAKNKKDGHTYLLGATESDVKLVKLDESLEDYFSGILSDTKFDVVTIAFNTKPIMNDLLTDTIKSITEGFSVDEDGNVKISISPKQSYMDEYSQNHKLLVENWKNKNYEGVKTNLAFAFTLIGVIERDKRFKERDTEIIKARAFAMNDFKTYLKKIQSVEKDFDFTDYYVKNKFDKKIIDISKSTIVGVKQLLKTILV